MSTTWDVDVPAGWEPVAELCHDMFDELDAITEHINEQIRREVDAFEERTSVISRSDLRWSTGGGVANFLRGVAECRPARDENLTFQRTVGQRSAIRGLPLQPLITSYHVGFRELWSILAQRAMGGPAATLLLERGSIVWERLGATASAVAEGFQQEVARREAFEASATAHFLEELEADPYSHEAGTLAGELGFSRDGAFRVIALGGAIVVSDVARSLAAALQASGVTATSTPRGRNAIVIAHEPDDAVLDHAIASIPRTIFGGIGGAGHRLPGARLSLIEAERALILGIERKDVCRFDDEWLLALVTSQRASAERLLAHGVALATSKAHLADAVRVFASSSFSVAESSRSLGVSANSLRYRLTRWKELTGWDPWTFDGLSRSMLALGLAGLPNSTDPA